jgi:phosphoglycerate dehydrogenase-like enzyme
MTIGIVGYGSIGRAVASLAGAFGARVIALRRNADGPPPPPAEGSDDAFPFEPAPVRIVGPDGLHELLGASDFVILAAPLTPETEDMIDDAALAAMRPDAWLINIARGRLVDDRALLRALDEGRIGGAALDTFREEPLPSSSPFYDLQNVIVTPHTSWSSARVLDRSIELFCDNLRRYAAGQPLRNVVDPGAGY